MTTELRRHRGGWWKGDVAASASAARGKKDVVVEKETWRRRITGAATSKADRFGKLGGEIKHDGDRYNVGEVKVDVTKCRNEGTIVTK